MDSLAGTFIAGGFSVDLTHHAMHALGHRIFGFPIVAIALDAFERLHDAGWASPKRPQHRSAAHVAR
jgi:hypothetical protein